MGSVITMNETWDVHTLLPSHKIYTEIRFIYLKWIRFFFAYSCPGSDLLCQSKSDFFVPHRWTHRFSLQERQTDLCASRRKKNEQWGAWDSGKEQRATMIRTAVSSLHCSIYTMLDPKEGLLFLYLKHVSSVLSTRETSPQSAARTGHGNKSDAGTKVAFSRSFRCWNRRRLGVEGWIETCLLWRNKKGPWATSGVDLCTQPLTFSMGIILIEILSTSNSVIFQRAHLLLLLLLRCAMLLWSRCCSKQEQTSMEANQEWR